MPEIYVEGLKPKTFKNNDTAERKTKIGKITPADARLFNAYELSKKVGIFSGYGGNCTAINTTITANADNTYSIVLNKGAIGIYGGIGIIEQGTSINIPSSITQGSFGVRVNLQNSAGAEMQFYYKAQSEALVQNDLNADEVSGIYEFELYKYSISGSVMTLTNGANYNDRLLSNEEQFKALIKRDYVVEDIATETGWIRVWASGFKEMGGNTRTAMGTGLATLTFDKKYSFENTNYSANFTLSSKNTTDKSFSTHITNQQNDSITLIAFIHYLSGSFEKVSVGINYYIAGF